MSEMPLPQTVKRIAPRWLMRHETMLAAILARRADRSSAS